MLNRLTKRLQNSLYIISKKPTQTPNYITLYRSKVFKCKDSSHAATQYDDIFL